jgi:hypothetical protein
MIRTSCAPARGVRRAWQLGVAVLLSTSLAACYPDRSVGSTEDLDLVTTVFDKEADFASVTTYTLIDSVPCVPADDCTLNATSRNQIRTRLRQNLNALGWQERPLGANGQSTADVIVAAAVGTQENIIIGGGWCDIYYGCWGGGYYPPGWGWYYPPGWYTYSFETGSLIVLMTDRRTSSQADGVRLIWSGSINGVLEGTSDAARALSGIDQMFVQSPYLR